jgi:hypothetical protein
VHMFVWKIAVHAFVLRPSPTSTADANAKRSHKVSTSFPSQLTC